MVTQEQASRPLERERSSGNSGEEQDVDEQPRERRRGFAFGVPVAVVPRHLEGNALEHAPRPERHTQRQRRGNGEEKPGPW